MQKKTIILGSPRSGTTLIAKLIDSHPEVLYRHEPDVVNKNNVIPFHPDKRNVDEYTDNVRQYINTLIHAKDLRTAFKLPLFKKKYRNEIQCLKIPQGWVKNVIQCRFFLFFPPF